jgi:ectoine hydroxylase-related dioxygenase (phytanoyl-CoA dioxygenase family)
VTVLLPGLEQLDLSAPLAHFEEHGYARLGRVLDDEGLALLRERAEDLMLGRVVYPGMFFQLDAETGRYEDAPLGLGWQGPSLAYRKLEKLEMDERFLRWINNPLFERVARARIAGGVVLYRAIIFNKGVPGGSDIPWHQDGGKLWGLSQDPHLQIWTALDDAPEDGGCLEVLPGSHRGGLATALGGVVPANQVAARDAERLGVKLPAVAGEAILVHNTLWHRSGRSRTGRRRLGLSICYMSAATRCLRKKRAPRVFFPVFGG